MLAVDSLASLLQQWAFLVVRFEAAKTHFSLEPTPEFIYTGNQPLPRSIKNRTEKFDKNITKRGAVPVKTRDNDELPVSKYLIAFFIVVVVGSSIVEILNLFSKTKDPDE